MNKKFKVISINITTQRGKSWGRVYVQFEKEGELQFIFKNWLFFEEKTYLGIGNLNDEPSYIKFDEKDRYVFYDEKLVLKGQADNLVLTPPEHKKEYGTPSIILKRLLIELKAGIGEPVENRRDWFLKLPKAPILSSIKVGKNYKIYLPDYELEIELEPRQKAVYILFLKHPEGITLAHIDEHMLEFRSIYEKLTVSDQDVKIEKSFKKLITIKDNSLQEQISKIKKYLIVELGETLAQHYYISGKKGGRYKIQLDPSLINS